MHRRLSRSFRSRFSRQEARQPQLAPGDPGEATASVALASERRGDRAFFDPPVRVRVLRVRSSNGQPLAQVGRGTLIDRLAVGEHLRVVVDGSPTLATSAVHRLERRGDEAFEVETANRVYLLEREPAVTEAEVRRGVSENMRPLNQLLLRVRIGVAGLAGRITANQRMPLGDQDFTRSVSLASAPKPGAGLFPSGVRVRVTRIRAGDFQGDEKGDLGSALLLDDLAVGESARFSLDSGPTVATSPVCGLEKLGARAVQLVTRNSTYRFDLIRPSE